MSLPLCKSGAQFCYNERLTHSCLRAGEITLCRFRAESRSFPVRNLSESLSRLMQFPSRLFFKKFSPISSREPLERAPPRTMSFVRNRHLNLRYCSGFESPPRKRLGCDLIEKLTTRALCHR